MCAGCVPRRRPGMEHFSWPVRLLVCFRRGNDCPVFAHLNVVAGLTSRPKQRTTETKNISSDSAPRQQTMMAKPGFKKLLGLLEFTWLSKSVVGNDDRKSLTEYASKPVKSQPRGPYSAEVRFAWKTQCKCQGYVWSQSRWSLDNMLWAIVTLMDFDCGFVSKQRVRLLPVITRTMKREATSLCQCTVLRHCAKTRCFRTLKSIPAQSHCMMSSNQLLLWLCHPRTRISSFLACTSMQFGNAHVCCQ